MLESTGRDRFEKIPAFLNLIMKDSGNDAFYFTAFSLKALEDDDELEIESKRIRNVRDAISKYNGNFSYSYRTGHRLRPDTPLPLKHVDLPIKNYKMKVTLSKLNVYFLLLYYINCYSE